MEPSAREAQSVVLVSPAAHALHNIDDQLPPREGVGLGPPSSVIAVCLCGAFAFLDLYVKQPLLPLFSRIFHEPKSVVGSTVSAATLGVAISAPIERSPSA